MSTQVAAGDAPDTAPTDIEKTLADAAAWLQQNPEDDAGAAPTFLRQQPPALSGATMASGPGSGFGSGKTAALHMLPPEVPRSSAGPTAPAAAPAPAQGMQKTLLRPLTSVPPPPPPLAAVTPQSSGPNGATGVQQPGEPQAVELEQLLPADALSSHAATEKVPSTAPVQRGRANHAGSFQPAPSAEYQSFGIDESRLASSSSDGSAVAAAADPLVAAAGLAPASGPMPVPAAEPAVAAAPPSSLIDSVTATAKSLPPPLPVDTSAPAPTPPPLLPVPAQVHETAADEPDETAAEETPPEPAAAAGGVLQSGAAGLSAVAERTAAGGSAAKEYVAGGTSAAAQHVAAGGSAAKEYVVGSTSAAASYVAAAGSTAAERAAAGGLAAKEYIAAGGSAAADYAAAGGSVAKEYATTGGIAVVGAVKTAVGAAQGALAQSQQGGGAAGGFTGGGCSWDLGLVSFALVAIIIWFVV